MKSKKYLIISIISFLLFLREVAFPLVPGRLINKIFTCQEVVTNSFPCYGNYDIAIVILSF
jgi:hypothetical protein